MVIGASDVLNRKCTPCHLGRVTPDHARTQHPRHTHPKPTHGPLKVGAMVRRSVATPPKCTSRVVHTPSQSATLRLPAYPHFHTAHGPGIPKWPSRVVHAPPQTLPLRHSAYPHFRTAHRSTSERLTMAPAPHCHYPTTPCTTTTTTGPRSGLPEWCTRHVEVDPLDFRHTPISRSAFSKLHVQTVKVHFHTALMHEVTRVQYSSASSFHTVSLWKCTFAHFPHFRTCPHLHTCQRFPCRSTDFRVCAKLHFQSFHPRVPGDPHKVC